MPIKPKDSRLVGFNRVKPRLQRLPKRAPIPEGIKLAESSDGSRLSYNPPASSPNPLITPIAFLPAHLRAHTITSNIQSLPRPLRQQKTKKCLTESEINEARSLRAGGMSLAMVAKKFSTSTLFISLIAPLSPELRAGLAANEAEQRARWSDRKQIFAQIRQNKRASWGL